MNVLWAVLIYKLFLFFCFISSYKKTHETLSHAGQKATAAFSNVGTAISKKFGDMRYRGKEHAEEARPLAFRDKEGHYP